ncbi:MAG: DUF6515 family protein [Steroidobacteraceae bacterium]
MRPTASRLAGILICAGGGLLAATLVPAHADSPRAHERAEHHERVEHHEHAARPHARRREYYDSRFHHDHNYLNRGIVVRALPHEHFRVRFRGAPFFFAGGIWYAPRGGTYVVVSPPIGVFAPVLPPFYTTIWVGGVPYYYADDTYYVYRGPVSGYEVVAPPPYPQAADAPPPGAGAAAPPPAPSPQLYIYPKKGQSAAQQSQDRYDCHKWATGQTGFDPTALDGGVPAADAAGKRADYDRAMTACLEGRGYTVK